MNDLLVNIKAMIIAKMKADQTIVRITESDIRDEISSFRVRTENKRHLDETEKEILLEALKIYFTADLNYENDFVELERGLVISDSNPALHEYWAPDNAQRFYWRKQRDFLMSLLINRHGGSNASEIINSIDFETEEILTNMENPLRFKFDSRGMVVGYVQSGKTANFTALISKAADSGYRFIVVLAGIHDELRQQTQIRIDRELTGHNNLNLEGEFVEWNDYEEQRRWYNLTSAGWLDGEETGEFSGKGINKFKDVFQNKERPVIAIIKKNVRIMDRLIKWIRNSEESDRINVPVLIIDDEADQASVDGNATREDTDPTKTNASIRKLISLFQRTAYVGYTATPFANVFIKHDAQHEELGDDLYPRNFIHSLPEPRGYFGTRRIFHDNLDEFFVTEIKDPGNEKKELADRGNITSDLASAIYSFIIGIAVRSLRGQSHYPMSMMINVDHRVTKMDRIGALIDDFIRNILPTHYIYEDILDAFNNLSESGIILNEKLNTGNIYFHSDTVVEEAITIIKSKDIKVRILNSYSDDKLDYAKEPSMKVIAIGGNKLSRGLTLEGLMVTFYLRESKQFDTLLQMGRWFGYRKGYEDLVRIYTSKTLWNQFKDLAIVELEFRENVREMVDENRTPKDFAIGVRQIMGLLPTAKNKLGAAVLESYFGGRQVSVTRLLLDNILLGDENTKFTKILIQSIIDNQIIFEPIGSNDFPSRMAKHVPAEFILQFLSAFNVATDFDGSPLEFDKINLVNYIKKRIGSDELRYWNVGIISIGANIDDNRILLPGDITIRAVNRARLKTSPVNGAYNIKAITSKTDRMIDLLPTAINEYDGRNEPLLLLYFISRNSMPRERESITREALYLGISKEKHRDPVSYSIIFPSDNEGSGIYIQKV